MDMRGAYKKRLLISALQPRRQIKTPSSFNPTPPYHIKICHPFIMGTPPGEAFRYCLRTQIPSDFARVEFEANE